MNEISFEKAPIIELIAELRWTPPGTAAPAPGQVTIVIGPAADEFFLRFGTAVAKEGFTQAEKLVPHTTPVFLHQVIWRFRRPGDNSTLLQVGPGLFTANALQPYRRWKDFRPTVELGVKALLESRDPAEKNQDFIGVSLRYINAFTGDLLAGKAPNVFIEEVLGFKQTLPESIKKITDTKGLVSSNANLLIPIANTSKVMSVAVGDGTVNAAAAAMFDVTVSERNPTASTEADVMQAFDKSRDIIHECFLTITEPVKNVMKPLGADHAT